MRSGRINLVVVQGSKEKSGSEVALEGEVGAGRRKVTKKSFGGRVRRDICKQGEINIKENEKWFKEKLRKSCN